MELVHSLTDMISGFSGSEYALWILIALSFAESSFFPIPPDVLMIPLALANPAAALFYALVTTVSSTLGGGFGYFIGQKGGKPVLNRVAKGEKINLVRDYYHKYDAWAVGIAAFTPIPYKVFTIAAGVFDLNFPRFMIMSFLGRGGRFFLVGGLIWFFGPTIQYFLDKYFELAVVLFTLLLIGGFAIFSLLAKKNAKANKDVEEEVL
jgi:membrane protein YqaA with SNARE-associated domain